MDAEKFIALGSACDIDQRGLIDSIPLLEIAPVANYLSFGLSNNVYEHIARTIIDNRYAYYGWKNYMYCYINSSESGLDYIVGQICSYASSISVSSVGSMLVVFRLLYSSIILVTLDSSDRYVWKYFNDRVWMQIDKQQIKGMLYARAKLSNIAERLHIQQDKVESVMDSVCLKIMRGDINSYMFSPGFNDDSDDKETTFCMRTCIYDIKNRYIRRPLPGDSCTLAGDVDPDKTSWDINRSDMIGTLSKWMGGDDVANSYLDILACALSEFGPRYAVINSGTGADGKSTFFHIVSKLFGSYCMTTPGTGPAIDTRGSNDATPVANAMISKRVYITTDATNVWKLLTSPGFKSITGGDQSYTRKLYKEASSSSPRLKALSLINTNQEDFVATSINELTRIRIVKWSSKRITDEDRDIIPKHQSIASHKVIHKFENIFINKYGSCMMIELIGRHMELMKRSMTVDVCPKIRQWTRDTVAPKTILRFIHACTQQTTIKVDTDIDDATSYALMLQGDQEDVSVEKLFMTYKSWQKTGARFSNTDPTSMETFRIHLEFYYPISRRIASDGTEELYIKGVCLKPDVDFLNLLYPSNKGINTIMQAFGDPNQQHNQQPSIAYIG